MSLERWSWIPNALTSLRIVLVAPFAWALQQGSYAMALLVFFVAAATDGVDGFLARRFNWRTRFGAVADPLADKALLVTSYMMLTLTEVLPLWLFLLVLGRDLLIVGGALAYHYCIGPFEMQPSLAGKLNTLVQIVVALAIIVFMAGFPVPEAVLELGILVVAVSAVISGGHYLLVWGTRAWRARRS